MLAFVIGCWLPWPLTWVGMFVMFICFVWIDLVLCELWLLWDVVLFCWVWGLIDTLDDWLFGVLV